MNLKQILSIIRIKNDEKLLDMARKLNVSVSYLSSIENNNRKIPTDLLKKLFRKYHLSKNTKDLLISIEKQQKYDEVINFCKEKNITKKDLQRIYEMYQD